MRARGRDITGNGEAAGTRTRATVQAAPVADSPTAPAPTPAAPSAPEPTPSAPAPAESPAPDPQSEPDGGPALDTPLAGFDAYGICIDLAVTYYRGDPALIEFAAFEDAQVVTRDDGYIYTYIEVIDRNQEASRSDDTAAECILGGTVGEPERILYGVMTRNDDHDPNAPLPTA